MQTGDQELLRYIEHLQLGGSLSPTATVTAVQAICSGSASLPVATDFLRKLSPYQIRAEQLVAVIRALQPANTLPYSVSISMAGTGGFRFPRPNTTSVAGLMLAACGAKVLSHGNRGSHAAGGSADFFATLLRGKETSILSTRGTFERSGFGHIPVGEYFHFPAVVGEARSAVERLTIFNLVGPFLSFTKHAGLKIIGVASPDLLPLFQDVARLLHAENYPAKTIVFISGQVGRGKWIDEASTCGLTMVSAVDRSGDSVKLQYSPKDFGLCREEDFSRVHGPHDDVTMNAETFLSIVNDRGRSHSDRMPLIEWFCSNAGLILFLAKGAKTIEEGRRRAQGVLHNGGLGATVRLFRGE